MNFHCTENRARKTKLRHGDNTDQNSSPKSPKTPVSGSKQTPRAIHLAFHVKDSAEIKAKRKKKKEKRNGQHTPRNEWIACLDLWCSSSYNVLRTSMEYEMRYRTAQLLIRFLSRLGSRSKTLYLRLPRLLRSRRIDHP